MTTTIETPTLGAATKWVLGGLGGKAMQVHHSAIWLKSRDGGLEVWAADDSQVRRMAINTLASDDDIDFTAYGTRLAMLAKTLRATEVELIPTNGDLLVKSGPRSEVLLRQFAHHNHMMLDSSPAALASVAGEELTRALQFASIGAARPPAAPIGQAVQIHFTPGRLEVESTDRHRLHVASIESDYKGVPLKAIIPARYAQAVDMKSGVMVSIMAGSVRFTSKLQTIQVQQVDGKFPDLETIRLGFTEHGVIRVAGDELAHACQVAKSCAQEVGGGWVVRLAVKGDELVVHSTSEHGVADAAVEVQNLDDTSWEATFNAANVIPSLGAFDGSVTVAAVVNPKILKGQIGAVTIEGDGLYALALGMSPGA